MNKDLESVKFKGVHRTTDIHNESMRSSYCDDVPVKLSKKEDLGKTKPPVKKTVAFSKLTNDQEDKVFDLERENTGLKSKENLLENEIVKMKTKLRRIEELMRKKRSSSSASKTMLPAEVQKQLQEEIDKLVQENEVIKQRNKKLKAIEKDLNIKSITKKDSTNKFAHIKGKLHLSNLKLGDQAFHKLLEELRVQLVHGEKQIITLTSHRDQVQQKMPDSGRGNIHTDLDNKQREMTELCQRISQAKAKRANDEHAFSESKEFIKQKQLEIQDLSRECEKLAHQNFQITVKAQQAKELSEDLNSIRAERDQIEKSITQITSYPFLKNQTGEPSAAQRVAQLELRLQEITKVASNTNQEEVMKLAEVTEQRARLNKIKGENDYVKGQHSQARGKYIEEHGQITLGEVQVDLAKMDKHQYAQALNDLSIKKESHPIWRDYGFLERDHQEVNLSDIKQLKDEIRKVKHENKEFAAELDKAQTLLRLQTDIEKENRQYYLLESERLKLVSESNNGQALEMAKRVEEQSQLIGYLKHLLGLEQGQSKASFQKLSALSPSKNHEAKQNLDAFSDYSIRSNDSQVKEDWNSLDLKVMDGSLNQELIENFLKMNKINSNKFNDLMTLVSVDFYDHATQTTQATQGFSPQYNSQISFKNKVDSFYITNLSQKKIKFEVYSAEVGKTPILLGRCESLLSELVNNQNLLADDNGPSIEKQLNIVPAAEITSYLPKGADNQVLGTLRVKFRLRKPIQAAVKFYRDMNRIKDASRQIQTESGSVISTKEFLITIDVQQCKNLFVTYGDLSKIAPFFFYQFYTFNETYSSTLKGENPSFLDRQTFEMKFDDSSIKYLQTQTLDIIVFDDNAPVNGLQFRNLEDQVDDMIGTAQIPLEALAKGQTISGDFMIVGNDGEGKGQISVTISISEVSQKAQEKQTYYTQKLENEIIGKIARKLGSLSIDIDLAFGIFSKGKTICTKEDFKYNCLQRLGLIDQISEQELDQFLKNHAKLKVKGNIQQTDFLEIFSSAVLSVRNELMNQEVLDRTQTFRYREAVHTGRHHPEEDELGASLRRNGSQLSHSHGKSLKNKTTDFTLEDFKTKDAIDVLVRCIKNSSYEEINNEIRRLAVNESISALDLRHALQNIGLVSDFDAQNVVNVLAVGNHIRKHKFTEFLDEALLDARFSSYAVKKFDKIVMSHSQTLADSFISKDINRDGKLALSGFKAALLEIRELSDYQLTITELKEIFALISRQGFLHYVDYFLELEPRWKSYFPQIQHEDCSQHDFERGSSHEHSHHDMKQVHHDHCDTSLDHSAKLKKGHTHAGEQWSGSPAKKRASPALLTALGKIEQFMVTQDVTLSILFNVIDTNSDNSLSKPEFKTKMRGLQMGLEEEELESLFKDLDINNDGQISYNEFISQFNGVNTTQIIKRVRRILYGASMSAEYIFNKNCAGDKIYRVEFKNLLGSLIDNLAEFEVNCIFSELDKDKRGFVPKDNFLHWFSFDEQEKQFQVGIEDILKPLATYLDRKKVQVSDVFKRYDQNKSGQLSAQELQAAVKDLLQFDMTNEEVKIMNEFFRARFRKSDIKAHEFKQLMEKQTVRKYESKGAKAALNILKGQLRKSDLSIDAVLSSAQSIYSGEVTIRGFKLAIFTQGCMTQQQVNNLAKYMDRRNNGMIKISDVKLALTTDSYSPVTIAIDKPDFQESQSQTVRKNQLATSGDKKAGLTRGKSGSKTRL